MTNGSILHASLNPADLTNFKPGFISKIFLTEFLQKPECFEPFAKFFQKFLVFEILHPAKKALYI